MKKKILALILGVSMSLSTMSVVFAADTTVNSDTQAILQAAQQAGVSAEQVQSTIDMQKSIYEEAVKEGKSLFDKSQDKIKKARKNGKIKKDFVKEPEIEGAIVKASDSTLGSYGDVLVSLNFSSFGFNFGSPGHAAICSDSYSNKTVESYPKSSSPIGKDGVQYYDNTWGNKHKVYGLRVNGASATNYHNAAKKAESKITKPYPSPVQSVVWMSKWSDDEYYCSQLAWRAWRDQGYDIDYITWDNVVSPAELTKSSNVYCWYYAS